MSMISCLLDTILSISTLLVKHGMANIIICERISSH